MGTKLPRFSKVTLVLGAAMGTLLYLPSSTYAQSSTPAERQAVQTSTPPERQAVQTSTPPEQQAVQTSAPQDRQAVQSDDITRRDLARFDQFLDSHREIADQLRKTPSLIDDPQYLQSHPELNAYLQDHPSVKQEISARPDTFMRLEDTYDRDSNLRDRDAGRQDPNAGRQDRDADRRDGANDAGRQDRDADRRDVAKFDRFLDEHREIAQQVRKDPSLLDNRNFVQNHPALQTYLQENPGVRDQLRQDPNAFMRQEDAYDRDSNMRDRDAGRLDRDADRRDVAKFDRFLDGHREIAQQVRKDPSLLDNRNFVQNHPALQTYLQDNPGVRDQLSQDPNAFMRQEDAYDRDSNMRDRDAGRLDRDSDRRDVANFDRFLDGHREIAQQVRKDPSLLDNRSFVQNHPALQTYLQENPGVRDQLRQDPNAFMRQEDAYDRDSNMRDRDPMHEHMADFGGFLHSHSDIQKDLSRNPSVVKDHDYVQNHAELEAYLNARPDLRAELMANPQGFVQGARQYNNASPSGTSSGAGVTGRGTGTTGSGTGTTGLTTGTSTNPTTTPHEPSKPNQ